MAFSLDIKFKTIASVCSYIEDRLCSLKSYIVKI